MKMYLKYFFFFILTLCLFTACDKELDVSPLNLLTDAQVFSNKSAIDAYLATLYNALPIEDFNFGSGTDFNASSPGAPLAVCSLEAIRNVNGNKTSVGDGTWWNWWSGAYSAIRNVNNFIDNIPSATGITLESDRRKILGEALFVRAYYYFGLVKRYGGVPVIKTVQNFTGDNLADLQVPRNKEQDVYDFISDDLDSAVSLLPRVSMARGRANKYIAYALKSRAMLYAASIAKYGSIQLDGIVGITSSAADKYWHAAFAAADSVIQSKKYSLYTKNIDLALNFQQMFLDDESTNTECIFAKDFSYPDKTHSYDLWNLPYGVRSASGYSSYLNPTLELCEEFEYTDGTKGSVKLKDSNGNRIKYTNATDLFKDKDPRFFATFIVPFADWRGTTIDVQAGIIYKGDTITTSNYDNLYDTVNRVISAKTGIHIIGLNGIGGGGGLVSQTGFYARKYLNTAYEQSYVAFGKSDQSFIDFRLGEVLLNYAEAAIELGDVTDAKTAINEIRTRAGIRTLDDAEITRDNVRHERMVELALEGHRYWDIRRWRIADILISNKMVSAILPYYDFQSRAYVFKTAKVGYSLTFSTKLYYEKISTGDISRNPQLIQNPNY
jgi:starch-binding outer membrane protein, SusD/RagB family